MLVVPFGQDVELLEERLVVAALGLLVGDGVDLHDVLSQSEGHSELLSVQNHPLLGLGQRFFGSVDLGFQSGPLVTEGIGRHAVALLGVQADQAQLLRFELGDQRRLGVADLGDRLLANAYQPFDGFGALAHVLGAQLDRAILVVAGDGGLDQLGANVGAHRALTAVDTAHAEEVGVFVSVLAGGDSESQALATFAAEDRAAQIVLAVLRALAGHPLFLEPGLHQIEGVLVDQRLMPAGEDLLVRRAALVDDPAGVVGVAQHPLQAGGTDFAAGMAPCPAGAQPEPVQLSCELRNRVFAAGVELEGSGDEVVAVGIRDDAGNLAAIGQLVYGVEVAEPRPAVGAAVLGLLEQTPLDALAGQHRLILVVGHDHALIQEAGGGVLAGHRLGNRDQAGAGLMHQLAGLPVVNGIACPAGQRPDDYEVHPRGGVLVALFQLVQHGEEAGALVQINVGALARIAELSRDFGVELGGLVVAGLALSADRQAVGVIVGLNLPFGGNPQIDERPLGRALLDSAVS